MPGFEITNYTEWPITVSLEQFGPLYYDIVHPGETFVRDTGAVWFTVKAQLSPEGKCAINWVDAVVPVAEITISVLIAACSGGATAYATAAVKSASWVAAKAAVKEGIYAAAEEAATFGLESITGLENPDPRSLASLGFVVDPKGSIESKYGGYFGVGKDDYVVEDMGEYAGDPFKKDRKKYWVSGGPKLNLQPDTGDGSILIFTTSPLVLTTSRPSVRDLTRDGLAITRTATGKSLIYLAGKWHEIKTEVLNVVRNTKWVGTIDMTEDEIRTQIGEMKLGEPISPNIKNGSYLKGSSLGYYALYNGLVLGGVPQELASQPFKVPDRLIECMQQIPDGTVVWSGRTREVYFLLQGRRRKLGRSKKIEVHKEEFFQIGLRVIHLAEVSPEYQEVKVEEMFIELKPAIEALTGVDGHLLHPRYGKAMLLTPECLEMLGPVGPDLPSGLRNGVLIGGDRGKKYILEDGRATQYHGPNEPDPSFYLPDVIESVPHDNSEPWPPTYREFTETEHADNSRWRTPDPAVQLGRTLGAVEGQAVDPVSFTGKYEHHPDYEFVPKLDSGGNDIGCLGAGMSIEEMKALADRTPECVGFNSSGWFKRTLLPRERWNAPWTPVTTEGFYIKKAPQRHIYEFVPKLDSGGNDIGCLGAGMSIEEMKALADRTPECVGFNSSGWFKHTLLPQERWNTPWTPVTTEGFYIKKAVPQSHSGEISLDANKQLRWTNRAGVSWAIETPTTLSFETWQDKIVTSLKLGADNPHRDAYEGGHFRFFDRQEQGLLGFWFQGDFYTRVGATHAQAKFLHWEELAIQDQPYWSQIGYQPRQALRLFPDQRPYRHTVSFRSTVTKEEREKKTVRFPPPWGVSSVVVVSDSWSRRPTSIKVFGNPVGQHFDGDVLLGQKTFPTKDPKCCGVSGTEECSGSHGDILRVPDDVSKLVVPLDGIQWLKELTVEIDGSLPSDDPRDEEDITLYAIEVRGYDYNCFLSSACMRARGLLDDCEELTVLRTFRDSWLAHQPGGDAAIREYYDIAPGIVRAIDARPDAAALYAEIYNGLVRRAVALIQDSQLQEAAAGYRHFVESLRKRLGL